MSLTIQALQVGDGSKLVLDLPPSAGEHRAKVKAAIEAMKAQHAALEERVHLQIHEPADYYDGMITQGKATHVNANCTCMHARSPCMSFVYGSQKFTSCMYHVLYCFIFLHGRIGNDRALPSRERLCSCLGFMQQEDGEAGSRGC